jgi:hypothetical protein
MKQGIQFVPTSAANVRGLEEAIVGVKRDLVGEEFTAEALQRMEQRLKEFRISNP